MVAHYDFGTFEFYEVFSLEECTARAKISGGGYDFAFFNPKVNGTVGHTNVYHTFFISPSICESPE